MLPLLDVDINKREPFKRGLHGHRTLSKTCRPRARVVAAQRAHRVAGLLLGQAKERLGDGTEHVVPGPARQPSYCWLSERPSRTGGGGDGSGRRRAVLQRGYTGGEHGCSLTLLPRTRSLHTPDGLEKTNNVLAAYP